MASKSGRTPVSPLRKKYIAQLIGRSLILVISIIAVFTEKLNFDLLEGMNFFRRPSILHLLWIIWMLDMLLQIIPVRAHIALGSQKHFSFRYHAAKKLVSKEALRAHIRTISKPAVGIFLLWTVLTLVIGTLYHRGILSRELVFLICVVFYVCDLICVLIWCPFRLMLGNRCCTTCRIFNWDHLMMFSPFVFIRGFYTLSLFFMAALVFLVWEVTLLCYPERFWERTNTALRCSACTDKLCTQYCGKNP